MEHGFVETSVWERIEWLCNKALVRQKIGFIYGESHCGKTICMQEFQRRNNHGQTTYVDIPPGAGKQFLTKVIASALHVNTSTCYDKLIEDVTSALDKSKLLIIDEVHKIFTGYHRGSVMQCFDVLRYIHDKTGCGMVMCGTNTFRDGLVGGEFAQHLKQLRRRGLYEIQLPDMPPRADLDLIASHYGLKPASDQAEELMLDLVGRNGVAVYFTRLDDASEMAYKKREKLQWEHFVKAVEIVAKMRELPRLKRG